MKEKKRILQIDRYEQGFIVQTLNEKRNEMLKQNRPTDFVDEIILKTIKAPEKSIRKCSSEAAR
ncbi:MAG: hypothetical protein PHV95_04030 [Eubacteriales bacterium]|nr:hypothetical protein [Eubacteriales bacterium]